jgi:NhaP-type Na+/H+ or K+/H+ antiporter
LIKFLGLRGAVAFALSTRLEGKNANAMMTTILVVVVISVVAFGASTVKMLELLDIPTDVNEEENVSDDEPNQKHWFISFDDRFLKPLFTRQKGQYALPHDHWHHENEHIENFKLIKMNKQTTENHSRNNSIDTVVAASSSDSNNKSSENIT